jgi:hypothetical protein
MKKRRCNAFLITEFLVTLLVLSAILICFAVLLGHIKDFGEYNLIRQHCIQAASAQLDSITATSKPLADDKMKSLWDKVATKIEITDGQGQWNGLKLVKVKSTSFLRKKEITIELTRYVQQVKE